jgi:hypothetical protein
MYVGQSARNRRCVRPLRAERSTFRVLDANASVPRRWQRAVAALACRTPLGNLDCPVSPRRRRGSANSGRGLQGALRQRARWWRQPRRSGASDRVHVAATMPAEHPLRQLRFRLRLTGLFGCVVVHAEFRRVLMACAHSRGQAFGIASKTAQTGAKRCRGLQPVADRSPDQEVGSNVSPRIVADVPRPGARVVRGDNISWHNSP